MAIKALVLDLDGALYRKRSEQLADIASRRKAHIYLKRNGILQTMSKREIKKMDLAMKRGSVTTTLRYLSKRYKIDLRKLEAFTYAINPRHFGIKRDPVLINLLEALSKRYTLAIFSNGHDRWVVQTLKVLGINKLVSAKMIVSPRSLRGYLKPEQGAFKMLFKIIKFRRDEVLFIDDNPDNIVTARKLGIMSILTRNEGRDKRNSIYSILGRIKYNDGLNDTA